MEKASEAILALNPVTFHYKKNIDPDRTAQFGLVAEDVEKLILTWWCTIRQESPTVCVTTR